MLRNEATVVVTDPYDCEFVFGMNYGFFLKKTQNVDGFASFHQF